MASVGDSRGSIPVHVASGLLTAGLVLALALGSVWLWSITRERQEFLRLHNEAYSIIGGLRLTPPPEVETGVWQELTELTVTAYANVCFSSDHVDNVEMDRFNNDLRTELKQGVDVDTVLWIWGRLAETGPHGKQYVTRFQPQLLDILNNVAEGKRPQ